MATSESRVRSSFRTSGDVSLGSSTPMAALEADRAAFSACQRLSETMIAGALGSAASSATET